MKHDLVDIYVVLPQERCADRTRSLFFACPVA